MATPAQSVNKNLTVTPIEATLYNTTIVKRVRTWSLVLDNGGYWTVTTKIAMNRVLKKYGLKVTEHKDTWAVKRKNTVVATFDSNGQAEVWVRDQAPLI